MFCSENQKDDSDVFETDGGKKHLRLLPCEAAISGWTAGEGEHGIIMRRGFYYTTNFMW